MNCLEVWNSMQVYVGLKAELPYRSVCFLLIVTFSKYFYSDAKVKITRLSFSLCWWSHWKLQTTTKSGNAKCGHFPQPIMKQNGLIFLCYIIDLSIHHHQQARECVSLLPLCAVKSQPAVATCIFFWYPQNIGINVLQTVICFFLYFIVYLYFGRDTKSTL